MRSPTSGSPGRPSCPTWRSSGKRLLRSGRPLQRPSPAHRHPLGTTGRRGTGCAPPRPGGGPPPPTLADRLKGARKDIEAARIELAAAARSVATYRKLAAGARSLLERTQRGFELGANTLTDVLDARRTVSDADDLTTNAELRRDLAIEGVLRSQGRFLEEPR